MLTNLALVEKSTGHYDEALRLSIEALEQQRRIGDLAGEALSLNNLGALHLDREEFASAGEYLKPGLALCDRHGLFSTRGLILANLTSVALNTGQHDAAEAYAQRALEHAEAAGNRYLIAYLKLQFVRLALQRADPTRARADLRSALEITIAIARPSLLIEAVICFAEILAAQGESHAEWLILGFAAHHPSTAAPERDKLRARLGAAGRPVNPAPPWPGLGLDELVHRIVFETEVAYAPLIAKLRAISVAVGGAHHR
jgi:tetratricopeptide (TPR) repeat protein